MSLSRAQRRAQERAQRRGGRKPNRSTAIYTTKFQLEHESFDTIERLFEQIRNGELRYDQKDGWVIMSLAGEDMHVLSAMEGWIEYWQSLAADQNIPYDDGALCRLAKSLEYEKPMNMAEVDAAYAVVCRQRELYRALPKYVTTRVAKAVRAKLASENQAEEIKRLMRMGK